MSEVNPAPAAQDTTKTADAEVKAPVTESTQTTQVPEQKAQAVTESSADSKTAETLKPTDSKTTETKVAPEKYDLKLSEGSVLDPAALERIAAQAKAQNFSQEEAQTFLEIQEEDVRAFVHERKEAWKKAAIEDKEIGGEKLNENIALSSRVIDKYASPALKAELTKTGYGNHPELVRMFVKLGREMSEDRLIVPGAQGAANRPLEDYFYKKQEGA